jgi:hypothetical protein
VEERGKIVLGEKKRVIDHDFVGLVTNGRKQTINNDELMYLRQREMDRSGTADRNTREGKMEIISISVHLSLSSGTVSLVSTIDICG